MAILCKPAIAVPEYIITMEQTLELCQQIHAGHPQLDLALRLLQNTGIRKRHIVLPVDEVLQHRGFEERNSTYEEQSKRRTPPDGLQKGKGGTSSRRAKFYSSVLYAMLTGQLAAPALCSARVITQQRTVQHIFSPPSRRSTLRAQSLLAPGR